MGARDGAKDSVIQSRYMGFTMERGERFEERQWKMQQYLAGSAPKGFAHQADHFVGVCRQQLCQLLWSVDLQQWRSSLRELPFSNGLIMATPWAFDCHSTSMKLAFSDRTTRVQLLCCHTRGIDLLKGMCSATLKLYCTSSKLLLQNTEEKLRTNSTSHNCSKPTDQMR